MKLNLLITSLFLCFAFNSSHAQNSKEKKAPQIDMKSFFKIGEKSKFKISPNGKYYSFRADYKGRSNIFVQEVNSNKTIRVTNDTLRSIPNYFWKGNRIVYFQDIGGDENFQVFSVNYDGTGLKALTPFAGVRTDLIDDLNDIKGKENELMVQINKRVKEYFDPYLLNIQTGDLTLLYDNKENFSAWMSDNNGKLRLALKTDGVNNTWNYRNTDHDAFSPILTTSFKEVFNPASFDKDNKNLYVLSNIGRDKIVLSEFNPITKKEVKQIFSDKNYDMGDINYDRKKQALVQVNWQAEKDEKHFFDEEWKAIQKGLDQKFQGYDVYIVSYDDARTKAIITAVNARTYGKYYLYDFKTKETKEVANPYPWLKEEEMSYVKPITYKSRDGLEIHGYLTLPLGVEAKNLPVVINPHGGPWYRDGWYFNPEVQFLANRGYAVLQMNFRGSTGYGKQFWEISSKQWGKNMQNDITDGVEWLIKEGIADKNRVAIYGASYGGYATLAGVTFTPDLYAAAVDYVGVSNLFTFLNTIPPYWKPYLDQFHEMVGDPKKDTTLLNEASPALHADKIKTPLFIAQGTNDPRVNKAESDQMVDALRKRGVQVEYMVKDNEGHAFHNQDNQYDFYGAMEVFLAKYLKPKK